MDKRHEKMLSRIRNDAIRAFGKDGANSWMHRKWRVFNNQSPVEMANSPDGTKEVLDHIALLTAADFVENRRSMRNNEH